MKPGTDPQIHFREQNSDRNGRRILCDPVIDIRYEDTFIQGLSAEYAGIIQHAYVDEKIVAWKTLGPCHLLLC